LPTGWGPMVSLKNNCDWYNHNKISRTTTGGRIEVAVNDTGGIVNKKPRGKITLKGMDGKVRKLKRDSVEYGSRTYAIKASRKGGCGPTCDIGHQRMKKNVTYF